MEETASINFIQVIIAGMFLMFLFAAAIIIFVMIYQGKLMNEKLKTKELKLAQERDLLHNSFRIQEDERQTFAANLHDELGAQLSLTKMTISSLEYTEKPQETIKNSLDLLDEMANSIRQISYNLMPPSLNQLGLNLAVKEFLNRIETNNIALVFEEDGLKNPLSDEVKLQLFRIMQEALNNALKYSFAKTISVSILSAPKGVELIVADNGIGFLKDNVKGLGILNIKRRSEMINYRCDLESSSKGTTVIVKPLIKKVV